MTVPGFSGSMTFNVGTNYGVIFSGDHNKVVLQVAAPPSVTPRTPAAVHRPRSPEGFLDRRVETGTLLAALNDALNDAVRVDVSGPPRIGKSWFLQQAGDKAGAQFADGALFLPPGLKGAGDVLQSLFEMFYAAVPAIKPSATEMRERLADKRALIVCDDDTLTPAAWREVRDAARACRFLVAHEHAVDDRDSVPLALAGLPLDDAMALAERVHGAVLDGALYTQLLARCREAGGHPQRVIDAVRALGAANAATAAASAFGAVPAAGSDERTVLDTVEAFAPHAVPLDCLPELSGLAQPQLHVPALLATGWLQVEGDALLPGPATRLAATAMTDAEGAAAQRRSQGLRRLGQMARADAGRRRQALRALPLLWFGLAQSAAAGQHAEVLALGRAWDGPLTLSGLWDGWRELLAHHLESAQALGDAAAQAWALHQGGTRELALGQVAAASALFGEALQIEQGLGDTALQVATQYHLDQIALLLPPVPPAPPPPLPPPGPPARGFQLAGGAALVGVAGLAWLATGPGLPWQVFEPNVRVADNAAPAPPPALPAAPAHPANVDLPGPTASTATRAPAPPTAEPAPATSVLALDPPALDFGPQDLGQRSPPQAVQVHNPGPASLRFTKVAVVPSYAGFSVDAGSCGGATLAPGEGCALSVSFTPHAGQRGPREGKLRLSPEAGPPWLLPLRGQGTAAEVQLSPTRLDFGALEWPPAKTPAGAPKAPAAPRTVLVSNRGDAPLRLAQVRAGGANVADFPFTENCPAVLAPGKQCELKVRYTPQAAHSSDAYLTLDAPAAEGALRLPLLARAIDSAAAVPTLLSPKDGAIIQCSSNDSWPVDFRWSAPPPDTAAPPPRYAVVMEPGVATPAVPASRQTLRVKCPAMLRWRVEAVTVEQKRLFSVWRVLRTVKSGTPPSPPPAPPPPTASPPPSTGGSVTGTVSRAVGGS